MSAFFSQFLFNGWYNVIIFEHFSNISHQTNKHKQIFLGK